MEHSSRNILKILSYSLEIAKVPLCLLVAFSALFGYVFATGNINTQSLDIFVAVLLLACGGASFNSYQERHRDGMMARTRKRPLVQGKLKDFHAISQSFGLVIIGLTLLFVFTNKAAFLAGLIGITAYNLIYTRMKPWSIHAILPGALCGAVPPYIGWLASGAEPFSLRAMLPILLLIFWQIPHFFLVLLNYKSDYIRSLSPNMLKRLTEPVLRRIFLPWIAALATIMITFSVLPSYIGSAGRVIVVVNAVTLLVVFYYQLLFHKTPNYNGLFNFLNLSLLLVMLVVCFAAVDREMFCLMQLK